MNEMDVKEIQKRIQNLPQGSISVKKINGREYEYWQFRENGRQVSKRVKGEELISASSAFSLVDGIRRAMVTRQDVDANLPVVRIEGEPAFPKLTKKFPELNRETEHIVSEQEIDKNDHVNNAFYLKWTEDILQKNGIAAGRIAGCWIFYAKELTLGMKVGLMYYLDENQLAVRGMVDGEIYYSAALILKP